MSAFETGTGAVGATGATGPAGPTGVTGAGVTGVTGATGVAPAFVGARVRRTTSQAITTSTLTAIGFDAERFDTDGFHDNATNNSRLTVPTGLGGKYLIGSTAAFSSGTAAFRQFGIRLNGTTALVNDANQSSDIFRSSPVTLYDLAVGDYVEVIAFQASGGDLDVEVAGNYSPEFWLTKIG